MQMGISSRNSTSGSDEFGVSRPLSVAVDKLTKRQAGRPDDDITSEPLIKVHGDPDLAIQIGDIDGPCVMAVTENNLSNSDRSNRQIKLPRRRDFKQRPEGRCFRLQQRRKDRMT